MESSKMKSTLESVLLLLGRLEGKVDALLNTQGTTEQKLGFLEKRLNTLERGQAYWAGGIAVISVLVGWMIKMM